ncbi:MAG TPA: heparinase II/III family protein [Candidatus Didemnitutus sp.]|nr:heparinase II/III family protein [Candidatus Didemnitutus sp.]
MRHLIRLLAALLLSLHLPAAEDPLATLRAGHPRLLLTADGFAALRAAAETDLLRARVHRQIVAAAEAQLKEPMIEHVLVGPRLLDQSRKALAHVMTGAMAFRLSGDRRFADHARAVMATAAAFPDWNPAHFLDVAEMATALAVGYDWLYDQLPPAERIAIRRALVDKALVFARPAYAREDPNRESFPFVRGNLTNNWNQVCNGGFLLAALALADEEPVLARQVIAGVRETLPQAMAAYEPDGAYPEGPVYWGYGTRYNILILAALESALGRDFDLGRLPAFRRTALFRHYVQGPTGLVFNYADGRPVLGYDSGLTWLSQRYGYPAIMRENRALLAAEMGNVSEENVRFLATHAIWFPAPDSGTEARLPLDVRFRGPSQVAIFCSAWDDPRALWAGFKAGSNAVNHGHLDLGSFVLEADGERWVHDLGPDDYNLPGYWERGQVTSPRWQYYRLNNLGHSTITPGAALQLPKADAPIIAYESTPARAFAVADLTSAYPTQARSFLRGLALLDRSRVLVQDDVEGLKPGLPLNWRVLTTATIALEGQRATLTQNGRTLRVEILSPATAVFTTRPATPPTAAEDQNKGFTELVATVPATTGGEADIRLAVLLTPVGEKWPARPIPTLQPLAGWK